MGLFLLPVLATVALYLPSGLLMPVRLVTLVLAGLAVWQVAQTRRVPAPRVLAGVSVVAASFVVFGTIGMLRYPDRTSWVDASHVGFIIITCVSLAILTTTRRRALASIWGWVASGVVAGVVGVWEILTAKHLPGNLPAQRYAGKLEGWNEISSFFDNPNLYAYHIVATMLLLPVVWSMLRDAWTRWLVLPFGAVLSVLLWWTDGRMAMVTLVCGLLIWSLRFRWSRLVALAAAAVTGLTMVLNVPPGRTVLDFIKLALDNIQWAGTSTWVRAEMARSGWWMLQQSNYLGVGPGGYARWAFDPANPHKYQELNNAHWGMVEVVAEYGIVTLALLLVALVAGAVMALRAAARLRPAGAARALDRTLMLAGMIAALTLPVLCVAHSTWLRQPLTAVHLGLIVSLLAVADLRSSRPTTRSLDADPSPAAEEDSAHAG